MKTEDVLLTTGKEKNKGLRTPWTFGFEVLTKSNKDHHSLSMKGFAVLLGDCMWLSKDTQGGMEHKSSEPPIDWFPSNIK